MKLFNENVGAMGIPAEPPGWAVSYWCRRANRAGLTNDQFESMFWDTKLNRIKDLEFYNIYMSALEELNKMIDVRNEND